MNIDDKITGLIEDFIDYYATSFDEEDWWKVCVGRAVLEDFKMYVDRIEKEEVMKEITKYASDDGKLWDTKEEAEERDTYIKMDRWYLNNPLCCFLGYRVEWGDLYEWMNVNREWVEDILNISREE